MARVERLVNEAIQSHTPVTCEEMTVAQAKEQGAIGLFESKYGEKVKVYTMGPYSKEICGRPSCPKHRRSGQLQDQEGGKLLRGCAAHQGRYRGQGGVKKLVSR